MSNHSIWDRFEQIDALLAEALDLGEAERDAFLVVACAGDRELLRTMRSLVRSSERAEDRTPSRELFEAALTERAAAAPDTPDPAVGSTIGPYRLDAILGAGGMGTVYLGERVDGAFDRKVAIKILHRALNVDSAYERFRIERQILASLDHPCIAQLIDGGAIDDGRPFLVMELVDGVSILRYANDRGLGIEDRVRLIVSVADAVEYAHRHMVIHRDLKPSNILVTNDGRVKLLDFGIAKLLEPAGEGSVPQTTRTDVRFVTPEYAAPEQLLGEPVSTQTDVFGLAALLYELLTGVRPYNTRETGSVLERMIRNGEPTAPSLAIAPGEAAASMPDLRKRLRGDLDTILLRGLRTRPDERYASVSAMRDDLERHLAGRPVVARGDATLYRASRFIRRHSIPVALATMAFLLAVGSAIGLAVQRQAVMHERDRAETSSAVASREAETARQVTAFLVDLFRASDPSVVRGDSLTVREVLERATERVDRELGEQPHVRAQLLSALGSVHVNLGMHERGVPLLERAVALHRDSIPGGTELAASLISLAGARRQERAWSHAIAAYRDALSAALAAGNERLVARAESGIGEVFVMTDQADSAELALESALARMAALDDYPENDRLATLNSMAGLVRRREDLPGAERLYREILDRQRQLATVTPMAIAATLNNLAVVRRMQGEYDDARTLYTEAIDTLIAVLGPGHRQTLMLQGNLARTLTDMGRADDAIAVYRARVAAAREQWPAGHWQIADMLMNLGGSFIDAGRPREAIEPLRAAVETAVAELGPSHSWTHVYRGWLGTALALAGHAAESREQFRISHDGLARYDRLRTDAVVIDRLTVLVQRMEAGGLSTDAARYRDLLGSSPPSD